MAGYRCTKCNKAVSSMSRRFWCEKCQAWYCVSCAGRFCHFCKSAVQEFQASS